MTRKSAILAGAAALALATVTACAGYGGPYRNYGPPPAGVVYVTAQPPPPRTVIIPSRPSATSVWISGYWNWVGADFVWVDGRWDHNPPRPGAQWMPDKWVKTGKGWYRQPGQWHAAPRERRR